MKNRDSLTKQNLVLILAICLVSFVIALQIILKPIHFLFADDWLLLEYLIPGEKKNFQELLQLVNGHNILTTKLSLLVISNLFGEDTLTAFALCNLALAAISCVLILRKLIVKASSSYLVVMVAVVIFFNFKQAQNYNMIISAHFIHSLFCVAIYLSITNTKVAKWRFVPLVIAPFSGAFGVTLLVLEVYLSTKQILFNKKFKKILSVVVCCLVFLFSYGYNLLSGNFVNNFTDEEIFADVPFITANPVFLPSFLLSILGSQFTPSSDYMHIVSQLIGLLLLVLLYRVRKQIYRSQEMTQALFVVAAASIMFTISGYDGSSGSIVNAYSNRYVTCTLLLALVVLAASVETPRLAFTKFVIGVLFILSFISGAKSGLEWVNLRSSQSDYLERLCYSKSFEDNRECLEFAWRQSFYLDEMTFEKDLNLFLKIHQN